MRRIGFSRVVAILCGIFVLFLVGFFVYGKITVAMVQKEDLAYVTTEVADIRWDRREYYLDCTNDNTYVLEKTAFPASVVGQIKVGDTVNMGIYSVGLEGDVVVELVANGKVIMTCQQFAGKMKEDSTIIAIVAIAGILLAFVVLSAFAIAKKVRKG